MACISSNILPGYIIFINTYHIYTAHTSDVISSNICGEYYIFHKNFTSTSLKSDATVQLDDVDVFLFSKLSFFSNDTYVL